MFIRQYFTLGGVPATGQTGIKITIRKVSDNSIVVNAATMTEIGGGWYKYDFTSFDDAEIYVYSFDGGIWFTTPAERYKFDQWIPAELVSRLHGINEKTRLLTFSGTDVQARINDIGIMSTPADIADAIWDEPIRDNHDIPESAGELLRRPFIQWRCPLPDLLNMEAFDPNRVGNVDIAVFIEDQGGFFDGLKTAYITNAGSATIFRIRAGVPTIINAQNPIIWGEVQNTLKYSVAIPTSNWNYGDLMILVISNTRLEINGHPYEMGEFYKTINVTNSIPLVSDVKRLLGLTHENLWTTNIFDIDGNHVSTEIQLYDSPENADTHDGVTGLVAKYTVTVTYLANKPVSILSKKIEGD
jgi:hypothetical protein